MRTKIINNLHTETEKIDFSLAEEIASLLERNFRDTNNGEYTEEEMDKLLYNKTPENIYNFLLTGLSVLLLENDEIIGFGMIVRKNNLYEAKYLNISPEFKGQGLGKYICDIREMELKSMGVRELYIESLRFSHTLEFHKRRGFYDIPNIRKLYFTTYMKKDL